MTRLAIFGCGGMGRELADIARRPGTAWSSIVFLADAASEPIDGIEVLPPDAVEPDDRIAIAIGDSEDRRMVAARFQHNRFASIVSPTAIVSPHATTGDGAILCDYVLVNNNCRIGRHFLANCFSQVSHDCVIGDYVTFSPRVTCNGWVRIEDGVFVGAGATIRNGSRQRPLTIGRGATVGMGALVVEDVPEGATVLGVPARPRETETIGRT